MPTPTRPLAIFVAALCLASSAFAKARPRVAVLGVSADQTADERSTHMLEELLLTALHETGRFDLLGRADIAGLLGFERQQQVLGCDQDASCVAQIASALDVPLVGSASLGRFGNNLVLSFKLIDTKAVKVLLRTSATADSESRIPDAVQRLAEQVSSECDRVGCASYAAPEIAPPPEPTRALGWAGLVAGVAIGGASLAFDTQAAATHDHRLTAIDFVPLVGYVVGAAVGGVGIHQLVSR